MLRLKLVGDCVRPERHLLHLLARLATGPTASVANSGPTASAANAGPTASVANSGPTASVANAGPTASAANDYLGVEAADANFQHYTEHESAACRRQVALLLTPARQPSVRAGCETVVRATFGHIRLDSANVVQFHGQFEYSESELPEEEVAAAAAAGAAGAVAAAGDLRPEQSRRTADRASRHEPDAGGDAPWRPDGSADDMTLPGDRDSSARPQRHPRSHSSSTHIAPDDFIDRQYFDTVDTVASPSNSLLEMESARESVAPQSPCGQMPVNPIDEMYFGGVSGGPPQSGAPSAGADAETGRGDPVSSLAASSGPSGAGTAVHTDLTLSPAGRAESYAEGGPAPPAEVRPRRGGKAAGQSPRLSTAADRSVSAERIGTGDSVEDSAGGTVSRRRRPSSAKVSASGDDDAARHEIGGATVAHRESVAPQPQPAAAVAQAMRRRQRQEAAGGNRGRQLRGEADVLRGAPAAVVLDQLRRAVLHQTDDYVVLNKPFGMPVHGGDRGHWQHSVSDLLPQLSARLKCAGLHTVHRLDRDTTGALLLAKTPASARRAQQLFYDRQVEKVYWGVAVHRCPAGQPQFGRVQVPLVLRSAGGYERMMPAPVQRGRRTPAGAQLADTLVRALVPGVECSLVEVRTETGVRHQVRAHLGLCLDRPLLGDHKYTYWDTVKPQRLSAALLHALQLRQPEVRHLPLHLHARHLNIPQLDIRATAPLPAFFVATMRRLHLTRSR